MKFKVLLRKRGGARARAAPIVSFYFLETRPFDGSCSLCLYLMLHRTRHARRSRGPVHAESTLSSAGGRVPRMHPSVRWAPPIGQCFVVTHPVPMLLIIAGIFSHSPHDSTDAFASTPDGQHLWVNSRRNRCVTASPPLKLPPAPSASDARGLSTQARREAWSSPLHRPCPGRRTLYRSDDTGLTWQLGAE